MKPLHLEITGLRSFRAKQSLDFADLTLFAVIGDTGAGKSSILEAIVFALYNASTWDARGGGALMSLEADAMTVVLEFSVGSAPYRVTRTVFRNARPAIHALRSPADPDYRFDGDTAVTTEIRRLIGLDYDTFRKTVVLPQGRFAELLNAREAVRAEVLGELLGLNEVDRLREKLEPARQEADGRLRDVSAARRELGEDPQAEAQRLEAAEAEARARREAMAGARDELRAKLDERRRTSEREAALVTLERESAAIVASAQTVWDLAPEHERRQAQLRVLAEQRVKTRDELEAADGELRALASERRDVASILGFTSDVKRFQTDRAGLSAQSAELEERGLALRMEEDALQAARSALDARHVTFAAAENASAEAERQSDAARERVERMRDVWRVWMQSSAALDGARDGLERCTGQCRGAADHDAELEVAAGKAASTYEAARTAHEQLERADRAAALGHQLHVGDDCPVCRRRLPAEFEPPAAPDLAAAKRALR
jgi:exonuclease SbcC